MAVTLIDPLVSWAVVILLYITAAFYAPFLFWSHVAAIAYLVIYHEKAIPRDIKFEELLLHDTTTFTETSVEEVIHNETIVPQETSIEEVIHSDTTPQETSLNHESEPTMERQAEDLLDIVKDNNVSSELKIKQITELKAHIKHRHVPDAAISPSFEIIRVGIVSLPLQDAAFSTLSHLTKRLVLQEQQHILAVQGAKTYPLLVERLGDQKDRVRTRASQAFTDFWLAASADVEEVMRDVMNQEQGLQFRSFVPKIVDCLEDGDGTVREAAKATVIELFRNAPDRAQSDLKKQLQQRNVRKTIATHVLSQLGLVGTQEVDLKASTQSHVGDPPKKDETFASSVNGEHPTAPSPTSTADDAEHLEPTYLNTYRELEDFVREIAPYFEGKETEQNWSHREKSVVKFRKITKGNAPSDFTTAYLLGVKGLLDGILKTVNSLRTTVTTNGCHLVQDIAKAVGPGLDPMVEILLQSLIKLCGGTKKISTQNGNATVIAILSYVTYNVRLMQHIWTACQDKNVQPRSFATEWLKTIITKHGHHKHILEHAGGLELIEKCINKGLTDANPGVRTSMRPTYWAFWRVWPERAEVVMSALEAKPQEQLLKDPSNPNPNKAQASITATTSKTAPLPRKTNSRPSLKETIAAQKRAKMAGNDLPERPESAQASFSPMKAHVPSGSIRPSTAMSTASRTTSIATTSTIQTGSLSSAPVRPMKPRRPDLPRPATADPYATRRSQKMENPSVSPIVSPIKSKPKTSATAATASSNARSNVAAKKADSPATSPVRGRANKLDATGTSLSDDHLVLHPQSPTKAAEDFTMVIPSMNVLKQGRTTSNKENHKPATAAAFLEMSATTGSSLPKSTEDMPNPMSPTAILGVNGHMSSYRQEDVPIPMSPTAILGVSAHMPSYRQEDVPNPMSPTAILGVNGCMSCIEESPVRKSMSPRAPCSRKENMAMQRVQDLGARSTGPMKVFEDPVDEVQNLFASHFAAKVAALEELSLNGSTNAQNTSSVSASRAFADEINHPNWKGVEVLREGRRRGPEQIYEPKIARRLLESGIILMKAGTLDIHGLRELQGMIHTNTQIWDDPTIFDATLMALLEYLEPSDPESETKTVNRATLSLKMQVLASIRMMLNRYREAFSLYYSVTLCRLISARKHYMGNSHLAIMLEETAGNIVLNCDPHMCIDGVLDLMETEKKDEKGNRSRIMGMHVLAGLLLKNPARKDNIDDLPEPDMDRLWGVSMVGIGDTVSDIRRKAVEYTLALHDFLEQEKFWEMAADTREDQRNLITYYLARRETDSLEYCID